MAKITMRARDLVVRKMVPQVRLQPTVVQPKPAAALPVVAVSVADPLAGVTARIARLQASVDKLSAPKVYSFTVERDTAGRITKLEARARPETILG